MASLTLLGMVRGQRPIQVGVILPRVFPGCDVLNAYTNVRRWLVAVCDPVLIRQGRLACPTIPRWHGRLLELFKSHFPATNTHPDSFPSTYFVVAWGALRARFSPPKGTLLSVPAFQAHTTLTRPLFSSSSTMCFSLLHFRPNPIALRSMRYPLFASSRTAPRRLPVISNSKVTLVTHGT